MLFYNYSSPVAKPLMVIDLTGVISGSSFTHMVPGSDDLSYADLSWLRALLLLLTSSAQWFVVGQIFSLSWAWLFRHRRLAEGTAPKKSLDRSAEASFST